MAGPDDGSFRVATDLSGVDWNAVRSDLLMDDFDNGRSPAALRRSFEASQHVAIAWDGDGAADLVVGTARLLSDGVCNSFLIDVWTRASHRRRGVATAMLRRLIEQVPGQHIGLQTDDAQAFYATLGFGPQPEFLSRVSGRWLDNEANR
ncbi:MAG: GNAT family N-acetyltransferase [Actinomycetota bacterium]|nr:GNAT family N-acetyltransferase [Actinomycetota bacterium]